MGKVIKRSPQPDSFAQGGKSNHMFGKGHAAPAEAGVTVYESQPGEGPGGKFAQGGRGHMFGKGHANPAQPGQSSKTSQ